MSPSDEFAAPVRSTNLIHTAPYVYNIQAVWRTGLRDFIIDGVDGQVQVNLVQALDLLGQVVLDWTNAFPDEPLSAKTALRWGMDDVQTDDPFADPGEIIDEIFEFGAVGYENGDYYAKFVDYDELHRCIVCSMYTERTGVFARKLMRFAWRTPVGWSYSIIRYLRIASDISSH